MTRYFYSRCFAFFCAGAFFTQYISAQNMLLQADFNDCALPPGWTVNLTGNGPSSWSITEAPANPNMDGSTIDGTCMVVIDDDYFGGNQPPLTTQFVTPPFDATVNSTILLSMDVHFREYAESAFSIYVFDGSQYVLLKRYKGWQGQTGEYFSGHVRFTADLSFYANTHMRLIFEYDDGGAFAWYAGFDNVTVEGIGQATNVLIEDFNGCSKPNGWDTQLVTGDLNWGFGYLYNDDTDTTSMNGSCFTWFDDDGVDTLLQYAPFSRAMLLTPWIDGTQFAKYYLDFDVILRRALEEERLEIGVWDGAELRIVSSYKTDLGGPYFDNFVHEKLDLSYHRAPEFRVVFIYDDGDGWGWWTGIDNVKISGEGIINDLCEQAIDIYLGEPCLEGDNLTAIFVGDPPTCTPSSGAGIEGQAVVNALWYRYHADTGGLVKIFTRADFNDVISVFTGTCDALGAELCTNWDEFGFTGETLYFNTTAGQDYFIRVSGLRGAYGYERGRLCIEMKPETSLPTPPLNDFCQTAIHLGVGGNCEQGNNLNASFIGPEPSVNVMSRADIWYQFFATTPAVEILSNADFSDVITLYRGGCDNLTEIATNLYGRRLIAKDLIIGENYLIQVSGFFATLEGNVCVQVKPYEEQPPVNDVCVQAIQLPLGASCLPVANLSATFDGPKPSCAIYASANLWFKFTAPASGNVKVNTGADFPAVVAVYSGTCNNLDEIDCFVNPLPCDGYFPVTGLNAGETYYLQIATDADVFQSATGGTVCLSVIDGNVQPMPPLALNVTVNCTGEGVGVLNVAAAGGTGNYSFFGNPQGDILYTGEGYMVIVSDGSGCERSVSGMVDCGEINCILSAELQTSPVSCNGVSDGLAMVSVANEAGEVSFFWSNGLMGFNSAESLPPGPISVTVTDATGCAYVAEGEVGEPSVLQIQTASAGETAYDANNATVVATPAGGTAPYIYLWSNGSTSQVQNGMPPGTYYVTVTDANGCSQVQSVEVSGFGCLLSAVISTQNVTCHGAADGQATVTPVGGSAPYEYHWSNGETGATAGGLSPGTWYVTMTDSTSCPVVLFTNIEEPEALVAHVASTGVSAAGANDGTAAANPAGGAFPYEYFWSNDEISQNLTGLTPGVYSVTVTDANGCQAAETVVVNNANCAVSAATTEIHHVSCFGGNDGFATVAMSGGIEPYAYQWSGGGDAATKTGLAAGTHQVTVTDAANCPAVVNIVVEAPPPLFGQVAVQENVGCSGETTGSATVMASGGTEPYVIAWESIGNGGTQTGLSNGSYPVVIEDVNGCVANLTVVIQQEDDLPPVVSVHDLTIELDENGQAAIGIADVDNGSYDNCGVASLDLDVTTFDCDDLGQNVVTLTVTDIHGNINTGNATVTVVDNSPPVLTCPTDTVSHQCEGLIFYDLPQSEGNCLAGAPGLVSGLPSGSEFPQGATTMSYEVADAAGNIAACSFTVTIVNSLAAGIEIKKPACHGSSDGSVTVTAQGGTGGYSYQWDDPQAQTTPIAAGLAAGLYHVTITDQSGCSFVAEALVPQPPPLVVILEGTMPESAPGAADGNISVAVSGGIQPYSFQWSLGGEVVSGEEDPANLSGGIYSLQVTDANGCTILLDTVAVETLTGATENQLERFILLYPNPTSGDLFVRLRLPQARPVHFVLYDVSGRKIRGTQPETVSQADYHFDLSALASGFYQLKVIAGEEVAVKKVVVGR